MNNHIYSTLFKTEERESDRSSKEIEQRKESQKTKKQKQGQVTLSIEVQSTALMLTFLYSSLNGLEKYIFYLIKICKKKLVCLIGLEKNILLS